MLNDSSGQVGRIKRLVRREVEEAWNRGDLDVIDELFADDCVEHIPFIPEEICGPEGHKEMIHAFRTTFPDLRMTIEELVVEGPIVAMRFSLRGHHDGDFIGLEPTGNAVETTGMVFARTEDGRIVESWANFDALGILYQIGAAESPARLANLRL